MGEEGWRHSAQMAGVIYNCPWPHVGLETLEYDLAQWSEGQDGRRRLRVREDRVGEGAASFYVVHPLGQEQGTWT
jgi:hypothetical protein